MNPDPPINPDPFDARFLPAPSLGHGHLLLLAAPPPKQTPRGVRVTRRQGQEAQPQEELYTGGILISNYKSRDVETHQEKAFDRCDHDVGDLEIGRDPRLKCGYIGFEESESVVAGGSLNWRMDRFFDGVYANVYGCSGVL